MNARKFYEPGVRKMLTKRIDELKRRREEDDEFHHDHDPVGTGQTGVPGRHD